MRQLLPILLCGAVVVGCPKPSTEDDTDVSDTHVVGTEVTGPSKIFDSCGPTDGPALVLSPGQTEDTCFTANDGASTHPLRLDLMVGLPTADALPHTMTLGSNFGGGGIATYCVTPDTCVSATSGRVTFTAYEHGVTAVGTYTVTLPNGQVLWGAFDAGWCTVELWCG